VVTMDEANTVYLILALFSISYMGMVGIWNGINSIKTDITAVCQRLSVVETRQTMMEMKNE